MSNYINSDSFSSVDTNFKTMKYTGKVNKQI